MEGLTRLVSESLARHGFDRPLDYRRLQWSRWFRCDSHHSLLFVPSKPGVFAVAEEIMDFDIQPDSVWDRVSDRASDQVTPANPGLAEASAVGNNGSGSPRRMLAVTQFFEDEDMAFVLDRMLSRQNPMRARLISGRYFVRFVVIEDQTQRCSICSALNQWMVSSAEKATGIGSHFATSLELTPATEFVPPANDAQQSLFRDASRRDGKRDVKDVKQDAKNENGDAHVAPPPGLANDATTTVASRPATAPQLDSGAAANIHSPSPFPSGF